MKHPGRNNSHDHSRQRLGLSVARLLRGSWRDTRATTEPARELRLRTPDLSEAELTEITPLLCRSGAGALAWWQLRDTTLADCPAALELREVYRRHRLSALLHEREIAGVVSRLRAEGIEPVLIKGWAIARRYPDRALRPYGDIDLCVRPDQFPRAAQLLERSASLSGPFVDLHCGFTRIGQTKNVQSPKSKVQSLSVLKRLGTWDLGLWTKDNDDWDELFARSVLVQCPTSDVLSEPRRVGVATGFLQPPVNTESVPGAVATGFMQPPVAGVVSRNPVATPTRRGSDIFDPLTTPVAVRVLCDEDHLRLLCLHLLRSGAHRPPWLCDVALLLEQVQSPRSKVHTKSEPRRVGVATGFLQTHSGAEGGIDPVATPTRRGSDSSFNWDICLGRNPVEANWVGVAVRLAHELLGAAISQTPFANQQLPTWLAPAVLDQWGGKRVQSQDLVQSPKSKVQSHDLVQSPSAANRLWTLDLGLWTDLYRRWDNPIRATATVGGRFDERSRLPYRLLESAMRLPELPAKLRGQRSEVRDQKSEGAAFGPGDL